MPTRTRVIQLALPAVLLALQGIAVDPAAAAAGRDAERPTTQLHRLSPVIAHHAAAQQELSRSTEWRAFASRHGDWRAVWNEATRTPHRAFGPSIPLAGFANDAAAVDRAVRGFIAENPALFGGAGIRLETVDVSLHGELWYARYRQTVGGVPVLFSDWEFRVGSSGRLAMFGADPRTVPADLVTSPRVVKAAAGEAARQGVQFDLATGRVDVAEQLAYVPTVGASGQSELRLAYTTKVRPALRGGAQSVFVDAIDGSVLWRKSLEAHAVTVTDTAQIHASLPTDPLIKRPLNKTTVNAAATSATTDTMGRVTLSPASYPTTITSALSGPYCVVNRIDGTTANFSQGGVANNALVKVQWTSSNSQSSERDAYYHVNLAHDWVKGLDPTLTAIDYPLLVNVNWNDGGECDATWEQETNSLNFWPAGASCPNTATMPDLVWHEYAHMVEYNLYYSHGAALGLQNGALFEGISDGFAALLGNDPYIANGINGVGTFVRDVRVVARYPEDDSPDDHVAGQILAGALWDLKTTTSITTTGRLMILAMYGLPDDLDDGVTLSEYFVDVLLADDNDADLSNGTPNFTAINTAFSAHGIGMNYFISVYHDPLPDQPSTGPFPVTCTATYGGPIGGLGSATLFYSQYNLTYQQRPMLTTGNPDEFGAEIPITSHDIVRYYIVVKDSYGGSFTFPPGAPSRGALQVIVGPASTLLFNNMEAADGWTVGYGPDTPVSPTGTWIRDVPVASLAQPGSNHTPGGTKCWVTGNAAPGDYPGVNDVDDGKTTLVTNTFNAAPGGYRDPVISYWRWYSDDAGDGPDEDPWRVFLSNNNGSTWARVENTTHTSPGWQRVVFAVTDYLTPTTTMKMRFVANDTLNASVTEAAIDDWSMVAWSATLDVPTPSGAKEEFALQPAWPNPAHGATHLRFSVAAAGRVDLSVYDIEGRKVRTLVDADQEPGTRSVSWDGRDNSGHLVASGPYFVRLTRGTQLISRAVVLMR